jgi:hypothetical protein
MEIPHIEVSVVQDSAATKGYPFQGVFAAAFYPRDFKELVDKVRWGFNNEALLTEALDRQRQFIETQYTIDRENRQERADQRTIAIRCINLPQKGLQLSILGRVCAQSEDAARAAARAHWREVKSIFPYDYSLMPATDLKTFQQIAGWDMLITSGEMACVRQVKRLEKPMRTQEGLQPVLGLWQSGPRANEFIWRALAGTEEPALLNISLHPTVLYMDELQTLWEMKHAGAPDANGSKGIYQSIPYRSWIEPFINRRLAAWKKFFFMQIHIVTYRQADESLMRVVGASLTRDGNDALPGYEIARPSSPGEGHKWCKRLYQLEMPEAESAFVLPRLSDLADMEEVSSVFRFPFPPAGELPGVQFIKTTGLGDT